MSESHLTIDHHRGMAWETELAPMEYGLDYFERYQGMDQTPMADQLNALRVALVNRHQPTELWREDRSGRPDSYERTPKRARLIDIGIGGGRFIRDAAAAGYDARGYDVNQSAITWLIRNDLYADPYQCGPETDAFTLWDTLEHLPNLAALFAAVRTGRLIFCTVPICPDLYQLRAWRHYRPREHLWHWTDLGFQNWIQDQGFRILESNAAETAAGRQDVRSYALKKMRP